MTGGRVSGSRNRETDRGDPGPTDDDLYPRTVLIREADVWRPGLEERVNWNGLGGRVVGLEGRFADVMFDEPLYAGGDRLVKVNIERLRSMDGQRPPSTRGMTIDAGKAALAAAAKELALAIHRRIGQVEGLKADYRNMVNDYLVKVCELLGVSLDELPALCRALPGRKKRIWTLEEREAAGKRMAAMNREGKAGRGKKI